MVAGSGPHTIEYSEIDGAPLKEVLVSRKCGEAVLRGAEVSPARAVVLGLFVSCNSKLVRRF